MRTNVAFELLNLHAESEVVLFQTVQFAFELIDRQFGSLKLRSPGFLLAC